MSETINKKSISKILNFKLTNKQMKLIDSISMLLHLSIMFVGSIVAIMCTLLFSNICVFFNETITIFYATGLIISVAGILIGVLLMVTGLILMEIDTAQTRIQKVYRLLEGKSDAIN